MRNRQRFGREAKNRRDQRERLGDVLTQAEEAAAGVAETCWHLEKSGM